MITTEDCSSLKNNNIKLVCKHIVFLIFVFLLGCSKDDAPKEEPKTPVVKLVKTLGGSKNDIARSVIKTNDGGYAVFGYSQSNDGDVTNKTAEKYDYWLLKFDANDELQWQKSYGGSKDDRGEKIIQTKDGGYAIIGYNKSSDGDATINQGFQDVWMLKLDVSGNVTWQKSFGFAGADQGFSVIETSDNGYLLTGILDVTASDGQGNKNTQNKHAGGDFWAIKIDNSGTLQWRNYFGGTNTDTCYDVIETNDGFILVGSSDSIDVDIKSNKGSYDYWVVKINKTGKLVWEKSFGGKEIETSYSIIKTLDNNFLLVGETRSSDQDVTNQNGAADVWLVKINGNGEIIWQKNYGGTNFDAARAITPSNDNGFIVVGSSRSSDMQVTENKGQNDVWVFKINSEGNLLWQKTIGGSEIDFAYGVTQLQNGSIIIVGESSSSNGDIKQNKGFTDALIIKIDEE